MSMATISIAPTPLKEYKNTIIWKTSAENGTNTTHSTIDTFTVSKQVMLKEQRANKDNAVFFFIFNFVAKLMR